MLDQQIDNPEHHQSIIGSLMYAVTGTRPDLAHSITILSQFTRAPTNLTPLRLNIRYNISMEPRTGLLLPSQATIDSRRIRARGLHNAPRHKTISQRIHLPHRRNNNLTDFPLSIPSALRCDNPGAISITENDQANNRTKHIDVHYHKIREEHRKGTFQLLKMATFDNLADVCTKTLSKPTHNKLAGIIRGAQ